MAECCHSIISKAVCCSVWQCALQCVAMCGSVCCSVCCHCIISKHRSHAWAVLQCVAACCSVPQRVAACCCVLLRAAACCCVQCVAVTLNIESTRGLCCKEPPNAGLFIRALQTSGSFGGKNKQRVLQLTNKTKMPRMTNTCIL